MSYAALQQKSEALVFAPSATPDFTLEQRAARLVVLDFDPRWLQSTIDVYGAIGPGWIMGPEYDYPVEFQEYPGKFRFEKLREEIYRLGGGLFLKPDLDERPQPNLLYWTQAGVAVPVPSSAEDADEVAGIVNSISLAIEQSGLFTQGSVSDIRNPRADKVQSVPREATKAWSRPKWRGSFRGGAMVQPNV